MILPVQTEDGIKEAEIIYLQSSQTQQKVAEAVIEFLA
jgi:hypothetical protein